MSQNQNRVGIFFYGTFMHPDVLAEFNVIPSAVSLARLTGFEVRVRPRVNLVRNERSYVYGTVVTITHEEISKLYEHIEREFRLKYFPEAVLVETLDGAYRPALCYITPHMEEAPAQQTYVNQLAECVRSLGLPEWYAAHLESFGGEHSGEG